MVENIRVAEAQPAKEIRFDRYEPWSQFMANRSVLNEARWLWWLWEAGGLSVVRGMR